MKKVNIGKIRIVQTCGCSGEHLEEGKILKVPEDITLSDARTLTALKRAVIVPPEDDKDDLKKKK